MELINNLKIKMRLFITMLFVSFILLCLTFFTTKLVKEAVKQQIPLQVETTIDSECKKITTIMSNHENTARFISKLNATKELLSWHEQQPDQKDMIDQWKKILSSLHIN